MRQGQALLQQHLGRHRSASRMAHQAVQGQAQGLNQGGHASGHARQRHAGPRRLFGEGVAGQVGANQGVVRHQKGGQGVPSVGRCPGAVQHQQRWALAHHLHMPAQASGLDKAAVGTVRPLGLQGLPIQCGVQAVQHRGGVWLRRWPGPPRIA